MGLFLHWGHLRHRSDHRVILGLQLLRGQFSQYNRLYSSIGTPMVIML